VAIERKVQRPGSQEVRLTKGSGYQRFDVICVAIILDPTFKCGSVERWIHLSTLIFTIRSSGLSP
jgi:hypothetical protein